MLIGIIILALGTLLLLGNLGVIYGDIWDYLWPIAIIAVGLSIILKKRRH